MEQQKQSRRLLEGVRDNLTQMFNGITIEQMVGDVIINGSFGCNDHEVGEFKFLIGVRKASSRVQTLNLSADFS